jgi:hypothetical protein
MAMVYQALCCMMELVSHQPRKGPQTMTENTAENTAQDATEAALPDRETLDVLSQALLSAAEPKMRELKQIAEQQAKTGDVGKLVSEAIESSEDPEVVKRRDAIRKAHEAIVRFTKEAEELIKPTLEIPSDEELEAMDNKYKVLASELNSFNQSFQIETSKAFEGLTIFDYLGELPGKRRGAKAGQGTGSVRPRVKSIEFTKDPNSDDYTKAEKNGKSTFSVLAMVIREETGVVVSAGDFAEAWTAQYDKKPEQWQDLPEVTEFVYSFSSENENGEGLTNHNWKIRVTR